MNIVGITGTNGAGKGTVVEILIQQGFKHYSASGLLMEKVIEQNLPQNRDSLIQMGNQLREKYGAGYIAEELIRTAQLSGEKAIIESLRTVGEVEKLKAVGGILLAVDADQKLRFERISKRGGIKDNVTWEEFVKQEEGESKSDDPNKQNLIACRNMADFTINNNGTLEDLEIEINNFLKKYE